MESFDFMILAVVAKSLDTSGFKSPHWIKKLDTSQFYECLKADGEIFLDVECVFVCVLI